MLDDRELRVLAGIEQNLSHTSPGRDRLLVEEHKPRLPQVLLGIGLVGFFVLPCFLSGTMAWLILLALGLSVGLGCTPSSTFPSIPTSRPVLPQRTAARTTTAGVWQEREVFRAAIERRR